jgi:hypothetical protein
MKLLSNSHKLYLDKLYLKYKDYIELLVHLSTSIVEFAEHKSFFSFVKGAANSIKEIYGYIYDPTDYFCHSKGWEIVEGLPYIKPLFEDVLAKYPKYTIPLKRTYDEQMAYIYELPIAQIGIIDSPNRWDYDIFKLIGSNFDKTNLLDFLMEEKLKNINGSKFFSFINHKFFQETFDVRPSKTSEIYLKQIKSSLDKGINRSILLNGPPGTGKTGLANTICSQLNFNTLKLRIATSEHESERSDDAVNLSYLLVGLKIDAVIIDDIDHTENSDDLLEIIEMLNKKVKVVFGTVNSLSELHPALIRPGRFDEIITIDKLDPIDIKKILGPLSNLYFEKVKHWPVAYLNELVKRSQLQNKSELQKSFVELNKRVKNQLKILKVRLENV